MSASWQTRGQRNMQAPGLNIYASPSCPENARSCRCGRSVSGRQAKVSRCSRWPGSGSADPPNGGSGSDGTGNLGHLVHYLEQVSGLAGGASELTSTRYPMPVDCQVAVSNPPAAVTRTPASSIPSVAASR